MNQYDQQQFNDKTIKLLTGLIDMTEKLQDRLMELQNKLQLHEKTITILENKLIENIEGNINATNH